MVLGNNVIFQSLGRRTSEYKETSGKLNMNKNSVLPWKPNDTVFFFKESVMKCAEDWKDIVIVEPIFITKQKHL